MLTAWIFILVGYWNDEKKEKKGYSHILFLNNHAFWLSMNMPVHRRTLMYIYKVSQPEDISLFSEAQVLTILWAISLSLPFYLKVDWTWNNVESDAILYIIVWQSRAWSPPVKHHIESLESLA